MGIHMIQITFIDFDIDSIIVFGKTKLELCTHIMLIKTFKHTDLVRLCIFVCVHINVCAYI